jgi:hypothetical protein
VLLLLLAISSPYVRQSGGGHAKEADRPQAAPADIKSRQLQVDVAARPALEAHASSSVSAETGGGTFGAAREGHDKDLGTEPAGPPLRQQVSAGREPAARSVQVSESYANRPVQVVKSVPKLFTRPASQTTADTDVQPRSVEAYSAPDQNQVSAQQSVSASSARDKAIGSALPPPSVPQRLVHKSTSARNTSMNDARERALLRQQESRLEKKLLLLHIEREILQDSQPHGTCYTPSQVEPLFL